MPASEVELTQLAIAVLADQHNPTILNPDFLKRNGIVDEAWELAEPPLCAFPVARVKFANSVSLTADPERVIVRQDVVGDPQNVVAPDIAVAYVRTLPHVAYEGVCINPSGCARQIPNGDIAGFVARDLLRDVTALAVDGIEPTAALRLDYQMGEYEVYLAVESERDPVSAEPVLVLDAHFHYDMTGGGDLVDRLCERIGRWHDNVRAYRDMAQRLLGQ
jgi:hypothetical protein